MLRRAALALALLAAAACAQEAPAPTGDNSTRTPCAACCAPGGSCDAAFKGTSGICCGVIAERPFCCPTVGSSFGAATCYRAGDAFRCRAAAPSRSSPAPRPVVVNNNRSASWFWWLFFLVIPFAIFGLCFYSILAARNRAKEPPAMVTPAMVAMTPQGPGGASYGYPVASQPVGQPVYMPQGGAGGVGGAGGGTSPWLAGGAGLLGGYMLGSTLGGARGAQYYPGGGAYYGGGGGDFAASSDMGGGGFGGGGGDFAADS
jgi:hypothetical protein